MVVGAVIIGRKFPYLKKLPVDSSTAPGPGLWEGFFPEARHYWKKIDLGLYRDLFFKELEKFLRRLRLVSLKLDSFTHRLIAKVRTNGAEKNSVEHLTSLSTGGSESKDQDENVLVSMIELSVEEKQKKEEHALIIEVAKNPKNPELYKKLAHLYVLAENFSDAAEALETALKLDPEDKKSAAKLRAVKKHLPT